MHWSNKYRKNGKPPRKDNKNYYNSKDCKDESRIYIGDADRYFFESASIRIPSIKRGKSTWKRFYKLFPKLKYMNSYYGTKLKKV